MEIICEECEKINEISALNRHIKTNKSLDECFHNIRMGNCKSFQVIRKSPIMEFESQKQAEECLKEWQSILFLTDWIFKINLVEPETLKDDNGCRLSGQNEFQITNKCGVISIEKLNDDTRSRIIKVCHKCVLIHEMLHAKYNWIEMDYKSYEAVYFDTLEHSLLEQMAKSLIMARYGLDFSWFKNF